MNTSEIIAELKKSKVVPRLVDDQVRLVGHTENLSAELIARIREMKNELKAFLKDAVNQLESESIAAIPEQEHYPVSNAQKRIWVLSQFEGGAEAYNIVTGFYLKGRLNKAHLNRAFQLCIQRHESLRTIFKEIDGEPRQVIQKDMPFEMELEDLSTLAGYKDHIRARVKTAAAWRFDLAKAPLFRVALMQLSPEEHVLLLTVHHIISDGWSIAVMIKEVMRIYEAACKNEDHDIEALKIQYKDCSHWLSGKIEGIAGQQARAFWKEQMPSVPDRLNLPADFTRTETRSFAGAVSKFYLDHDLYTQILHFCPNHQTTLFNFLRATLTILLHRLSGQQSIIIGTPVSGRHHFDLENQLGLYVNTLPLMATIDPDDPFSEFVRKISKNSFSAFEFQHYPFDQIVEDLKIRRHGAGNPLFDVMLVLQDTAAGNGPVDVRKQYAFELHSLDSFLYGGEGTELRNVFSKFDLNFNFGADPDRRFYLEVEYNSRLFRNDRIARLVDTYLRIITQVLARPEVTVSAIDILDQEERNKILHVFNNTATAFPHDRTITGLFEAQVDLTPYNTALVFEEVNLTYKELNEKANQLGHYLREEYHAGPDDLIGIKLQRGEWMIIAILATLKAGGAYVPVDPGFPQDRIDYILEDSQCKVLIDETELEKFRERQHRYHKNNPVGLNQPDHLAYVIYTSGSTGRPKGCMLEHRGIINRIAWMWTHYGFSPEEIILQKTTFTFDVSVWEIFMPLCWGASMVLCRKEDAGGPERILQLIKKHKVTCLHFVPSMLNTFIASLLEEKDITDNLKTVRRIITSGEALPLSTVRNWYKKTNIPIQNLYGPTEASVDVTYYDTTPEDERIPIGRPIWNTQMYIIDNRNGLAPIGVTGEICIGGIGLARGYLNKPELTAEKFTSNPFSAGQRMYKTGDLGRWLPDGNIEFAGRKDDQVKIRGYRIEPGEIQYCLEQHSLVEQAVVMATTVGTDYQLVAYWTGKGHVTGNILKAYLSLRLPAYMIPDYWIELERIPLTGNGKIDKKSLPLPEMTMMAGGNIIEPTDEVQNRLLQLWKEVLTVQELGITQNFFEMGGHSLKAAKLRTLIAKELGTELTLNEIFEKPTIRQQAELIAAGSRPVTPPIQPAEEQPFYPISLAQERLWTLINFEEASKAYNMPAAFRITGSLDINKLEKAFRKAIERHEILRTALAVKNEGSVQLILQPEEIPFHISQITIDSLLTAEEELALLQEIWQSPFDLEKGLLLSCTLIKTGTGEILSFNMHHIISDGWSIGVLYRDVITIYRGLLADEEWQLPELTIQYKDFAIWQRGLSIEGHFDAHRAFWTGVFREEVSALELPADFYRPDVKTYRGSTFHFHFGPELSLDIAQTARQSRATLFMMLMAGVSLLLKKYSGQNDLVVGTPVAGRGMHELQDQIGFYVNTLPLRINLEGQTDFASVLNLQKKVMLHAFKFQDYPFEMLVDELSIKRDLSRSPLFDVMVVLQNLEGANPEDMRQVTPDLQLDRIMAPAGIAKYDLVFSFSEGREGLLLELEYNTGIFKEETIGRMAKHLARLFEQVTKNPAIPIKDIVLQNEHEHAALLAKVDRTQLGYDKNSTIVTLFQRAVADFPDNTALKVGQKEISYRELDIRSGQLARILIEEQGVLPEDLVILHFDRSEWMLVGILAVLKAGAAYVPVDPAYPFARIDYILEDTESRLVLFDRQPLADIMAKWEDKVFLDITRQHYTGEMTSAAVEAHHLAYVIYTSGTTGKPKGVLIEHLNVTRLLFNDDKLFDFNTTDRWSLFHSYCFDFSVWEMYGALLYGGTLVIVPKETAQNSLEFYNFLIEEKITVLNQTPTAFRSLLQNNRNRLSHPPVSIRYLIFGGEALSPGILGDWRQVLPGCKLINMYGITETTVHVTYKEITELEIAEKKSNIGLPIPTLSCYVLDKDGQQVPIGVTGELYVGGAGVARGYLNRPALTAEKFINHPKGRLYRSGDYARILPSGDLEYIGRKDEQIKISGHRIEMGEIAAVMGRLKGVRDVIVLPFTNSGGEVELAAYYIPEEGTDDSHFKKELSNWLPAYMVPSCLIAMPSFPYNKNGKLDKTALPAPNSPVATESVYVCGRNDTDARFIAIWEDILERERIGIRDNFFDLGGNSLKATRMIVKIHELFGIKIDLKHLFADPTIENLSNYVETMLWMEEKNETLIAGENEAIF